MGKIKWTPDLTIDKDPSDSVQYKMNWAPFLDNSETISSATVTAESGLTKDSDSNTDWEVFFKVSGGTAGNSYDVTVQINTSQSNTYERSVTFNVEDL